MTDAVEKGFLRCRPATSIQDKSKPAILIQKSTCLDSFVSISNSQFLCGDFFDNIDPELSSAEPAITRLCHSKNDIGSPHRTHAYGRPAREPMSLGTPNIWLSPSDITE
jgi:hypothetical protein